MSEKKQHQQHISNNLRNLQKNRDEATSKEYRKVWQERIDNYFGIK